MTDPGMPPPITVRSSAIPTMAASNFRVAMIAFGAYAVGKGWFKQDDVSGLMPLALIIAPWIWGQVQGLINHANWVSVAHDPRVSDSVVTPK